LFGRQYRTMNIQGPLQVQAVGGPVPSGVGAAARTTVLERPIYVPPGDMFIPGTRFGELTVVARPLWGETVKAARPAYPVYTVPTYVRASPAVAVEAQAARPTLRVTTPIAPTKVEPEPGVWTPGKEKEWTPPPPPPPRPDPGKVEEVEDFDWRRFRGIEWTPPRPYDIDEGDMVRMREEQKRRYQIEQATETRPQPRPWEGTQRATGRITVTVTEVMPRTPRPSADRTGEGKPPGFFPIPIRGGGGLSVGGGNSPIVTTALSELAHWRMPGLVAYLPNPFTLRPVALPVRRRTVFPYGGRTAGARRMRI
jgi:hypothetical protein